MDYSNLEKIRGQFTQLNLLGSQIDVYDFTYTTHRTTDFPHTHPFHEFYYILDGRATFRLGNKKIQFQKGDILYVASGTEHMYLSDKSIRCEYANIAFNIFMNTTPNERNPKNRNDYHELIDDENFLIQNLLAFGTRHVQDDGSCLKSLEDIIYCMERSHLGDFICLMSYQICFFLSAMQNFSDVVIRADFKEEVQRLKSKRTSAAIQIAEYIWEHCEQDITIDQLADTLGYSRRSAQRILSDYYSVGYSVLLTHYRVARLKIALENGTDTLESFSEKCGYNDTRVLSRNFLKITGMTVAKFKKNLKEQKQNQT